MTTMSLNLVNKLQIVSGEKDESFKRIRESWARFSKSVTETPVVFPLTPKQT